MRPALPTNDPLDGFLRFVLDGGVTALGSIPLFDAVHDVEGARSITWYRKAPFQVQMWVIPPDYVIPEHTHPNVDSYEIYLGGQIKFTHSGMRAVSDYHLAVPDPDGLAYARGSIIRVRPHDRHGGYIGPAGGVFLSVQHWLNGIEPHDVAADYSGAVMGPDHYAKVVAGSPLMREQGNLTEADTVSTA